MSESKNNEAELTAQIRAEVEALADMYGNTTVSFGALVGRVAFWADMFRRMYGNNLLAHEVLLMVMGAMAAVPYEVIPRDASKKAN